MLALIRPTLTSLKSGVLRALGLARARGINRIQFWFVALGVGIAAGLVALAFRFAITWLETTFYGVADVSSLVIGEGGVPWWWVVLLPILGGLAVGILLDRFTPDGRVRSVADVIEGSALHHGQVEIKPGIASAVASCITLSTGGSTGREGPVVHLAGVVSTKVSKILKIDGIDGRDLLGCAVAAAVSASFNAPLAGALFAMEVILRHFAIHAFAPIVIAAVAGTVISRVGWGDVTVFVLPEGKELAFYVELPAFLLLGLLCGLVAWVMMAMIFWADDIGSSIQRETRMPRWLRPAVAGALLGVLALGFPHIIGVGYETTYAALSGTLVWHTAVLFVVIKVIAVAITMAGRMGGGVFSPSLMVGALTGLAFGVVATAIFPVVSGTPTLYALAGMGAVAAAVLGAPISTTLIVFELTGSWQAGIAVMAAVSMATAVASRLVDMSFFLTQLERRGIHLAAGPQAYLLALYPVVKVMRSKDDLNPSQEAQCWDLLKQGIYVDGNATLELAMPILENPNLHFIPVLTMRGEDAPPELVGALFQVDALRVYNRALAENAMEEHT